MKWDAPPPKSKVSLLACFRINKWYNFLNNLIVGSIYDGDVTIAWYHPW